MEDGQVLLYSVSPLIILITAGYELLKLYLSFMLSFDSFLLSCLNACPFDLSRTRSMLEKQEFHIRG